MVLTAVTIQSLRSNANTGAPPYEAEDLNPPESFDPLSAYRNWVRPDVPPKVGLQAGHWQNENLPDELARLRGNTGSTGGGKAEWEVNLAIAELTADILRQAGVTVEILPATIPPDFWADAFVAIHADGSLDPSTSGFKASTPRRDFSGGADALLERILESYRNASGLAEDPNVSRNMRGYYAFSWWRYEHAIHPFTPSVILETGFLTSPKDRLLIVNEPHRAASALAGGILDFLREKHLLP